MFRWISLAIVGVALLGFTDDHADADVIRTQLPTYPLDTCPVSGEALGEMGDTIDLVADGRLVRFCCKGCVKEFHADPDVVLAELDAAVIAAQTPTYPTDTCLISGEPLEDDAIDVVVGSRLLRFCCKGCVKDFHADPAAVVVKLDAAYIEAQIADYPLDECPLSGEPLGRAPKNALYGNQLVRTCCNMCLKDFLADPEPVMEKLAPKLAAARAARKVDAEDDEG